MHKKHRQISLNHVTTVWIGAPLIKKIHHKKALIHLLADDGHMGVNEDTV